MATDYNAINFKNRDIDKFSTRFGKQTDPEKDKDAMRTEGMTDSQRRLYNQKGELGQKIYAKKVAKENVRKEAESTATPKVKTSKTEEQRTGRNERVNKTLSTVGTLVGSTLGAVGLYNQSKNKNNNGN